MKRNRLLAALVAVTTLIVPAAAQGATLERHLPGTLLLSDRAGESTSSPSRTARDPS